VRSSERDVLLFFLAAASGSSDGWSYLGLGHAFVANMTGNTVLSGIAVFQKDKELLPPLIALICYALGAASAAFFTRKVHAGVTWARPITLTLLLEALIMAAAEAAWIAITLHSLALPLHVLLGCVAFAIGLQSGAMLQLKIPGIVTTYITGTWTTLMSGLVRFAREKSHETPRQKLQFEERLFMQAGVIAVYFLAAVLTGWLFLHSPLVVGAVSAGSVLIVALYAAVRAHDITES
jgi:uncharacterized membrane protein YoaK (UPF0700 family)